MVCGVPGSGKTKLAKKIVKKINACYIDKDTIQNSFTKKREGSLYKLIRDRSYNIMYNIAFSNLKVDKDVVIVAPHVKEMLRESWIRYISMKAKNSNVMIKVIWCYAPEKIIKERLKKRDYKRDEKKLKNWNEFLKEQPIRVKIPFEFIEIDTSKKYRLNEIVKFLEE